MGRGSQCSPGEVCSAAGVWSLEKECGPFLSPNTGRSHWHGPQKGAGTQPQFLMGTLRSQLCDRAQHGLGSLEQWNHTSPSTHTLLRTPTSPWTPTSPGTCISLRIHTLSGTNTLPRTPISPGSHALSRTHTFLGTHTSPGGAGSQGETSLQQEGASSA